MTRRPLTPEDRDLWSRVAQSAVPLHPAQTRLRSLPARPPPAPERAVLELPSRSPLRIGMAADAAPGPRWRSDDLPSGLTAAPARMPLRMDAGTFGRMMRGKLRPEARIDLHGMTLAEAHPALVGFILAARGAGRRLVLVITGKGRPTDENALVPARPGRLRQDVPRWLLLPPLAGAVLQVAPAHRRHGGDGAFYVYLRAP